MDDRSAWDAWQRDHREALAHLQACQREYHRRVAARALAESAESATARAAHERQSLDLLDAARVHLDAVRQRRPEV
jgi:hypothetical protein